MNLNKFSKLIIIFLLTVLGYSISPGTVSAITLSPTRFELQGNPGETLEYELSIINESQKTEIYYVSYSNFEAQGESGDPAFTPATDGLGTWIKIPETSVGVGPQEEKKVPFKINIPKDATPGGHFAVVFFGNQPPSTDGSAVGVGSQAGVLILLSVNGEVKQEAGVYDFNTAKKQFFYKTLPVAFEYRLKNDGGDRVKPEGKIRIHNTLFIPTERIDANPSSGNVLPGSTRKYNVTWVESPREENFREKTSFLGKFWDNAVYEWKNFALGFYTANLLVEYGNDKASDWTFFFVFPWELTIILIIVLSILYFVGKKLITKYNRYIIEKARNSLNNSK
jgi:hypothetical protein